MYGPGMKEAHFNFIVASDRKSLYTQLNALVTKAQEVANENLRKRSERLQKLLDYEEKIYEEEFANKVKSRIDEDIKVRRDELVRKKEENTKVALDFLEQKRVQQYVNSCYEIREALRDYDSKHVKHCQAAQIREKKDMQIRENDIETCWLSIMKSVAVDEKQRTTTEKCLARELAVHTNASLDIQVAEREKLRELEREERAEDARKLEELMEQVREENQERINKIPIIKAKYAYELLEMARQKKQAALDEYNEMTTYQRNIVEEMQRLEAEDNAAALTRKRAFHKATIEYIDYVKRMRQLAVQQQKMHDHQIDEMHRLDICTKTNIAQELERKAAYAALCHTELKQQICEQYERRLRDEMERHENKIILNLFARPEKTIEEVRAKQRQTRAELDKQVKEMHIFRKREQEEYSNDLQRASNDSKFCTELAKHYMAEGIDYLAPHSNWLILMCRQPECPKCNKKQSPLKWTKNDIPPEGDRLL